MNTTDLRNLLAERAHSGAPDPAADLRLAGTLRRARSIHRHRRIAAATTAVAAAAIAVVVITVPPLITAPDPPPQPAEELNEHGFSRHDRGHELLASGVIRAGERTASVTATPTEFPLIVATRCGEDRIYGEDTEIEEVNLEIFVGEQLFTSSGGSCGQGWHYSSDADGWAERGVYPDEAVTFTATTDKPVTAETEVAIGIYQPVPWEEYPFPPRPGELPDLAPPANQVDAVLESDPDDPNANRELVVDGPFSLHLNAQSPGIIRLRIDGIEVDPIYSWDYGSHPLIPLNWPPSDDDVRPVESPVLIEVRPEGFTGDWVIYVSKL